MPLLMGEFLFMTFLFSAVQSSFCHFLVGFRQPTFLRDFPCFFSKMDRFYFYLTFSPLSISKCEYISKLYLQLASNVKKRRRFYCAISNVKSFNKISFASHVLLDIIVAFFSIRFFYTLTTYVCLCDRL